MSNDETHIDRGDIVTWKPRDWSTYAYVSEYVKDVEDEMVQTKNGYWLKRGQILSVNNRRGYYEYDTDNHD